MESDHEIVHLNDLDDPGVGLHLDGPEQDDHDAEDDYYDEREYDFCFNDDHEDFCRGT